MILPFQIQLANALLITSKYTHDVAVNTLTQSTTYLLTNDIPKPLVDFSIDTLSNAVIMGDKVGNLILQCYVFLIHCTF